MPGSVALSVPSGVLPQMLCSAWQESRERPALITTYPSGDVQGSTLTEGTRRRWRLSARLSGSAVSALATFYNGHKGPTIPFYFYDPFDPASRFNFDATGVDPVGRVVVRFDGPFTDTVRLGRPDCSLGLVEVDPGD